MFKNFKEAVNQQFDLLSKYPLFLLDVDPDLMWETYLTSFSPKDNPIFRERTAHDCSCCRNFIKHYGNVCAIIENKLVYLWDIEVQHQYQKSVDALASLMQYKEIKGIFLSKQAQLGTDHNFEEIGSKSQKWEHFSYKLPLSLVCSDSRSIADLCGSAASTRNVFKRALEELTEASTCTVLDLIAEDSLYRGSEFKAILQEFLKHQEAYRESETKELYAWLHFKNGGRIRNSAIGSLLIDLSEGKPLEIAVKSFEAKVAPANYKRPKALITQAMVTNAEKEMTELGIEPFLYRRHAVIEDIPVAKRLFTNVDSDKSGGLFQELKDDSVVNPSKLTNIPEISLEEFISKHLNTKSLEVLFENKHSGNLVNLLAPKEPESNLLQWDGDVSWNYKGNVADSMKELVREAGGKVDVVLRQSLRWNDEGHNNVDLDIHVIEPDGNEIYFGNARQKHASSGILDIDITSPRGKISVENITHSDVNKMQEDMYELNIHNYSALRSTAGFKAEIEYKGQLWEYEYTDCLDGKETVNVAIFKFTRENGIEIISSLDSNVQMISKTIWNIDTNKFHKVSAIFNSPNHWDKAKGNLHTFFILEGVTNDEPSRPFYNEFLKPELLNHKRLFEVLGSKLSIPSEPNQLAGLGFSSTVRNDFIIKSNNRLYKVKV